MIAFSLRMFAILPGPILDQNSDIGPVIFGFAFIIYMGTTFLDIAIYYLTLGYYIFHIVKNMRGSEKFSIITPPGSHVVPFIVIPIYYYVHNLSDDPPKLALQQVEPGR